MRGGDDAEDGETMSMTDGPNMKRATQAVQPESCRPTTTGLHKGRVHWSSKSHATLMKPDEGRGENGGDSRDCDHVGRRAFFFSP